MKKFGLFSEIFLEEKIQKSIKILKQAEDAGAVLSFSGGLDSTVINHLIKNNGININGVFFNKVVECANNIKMIDKVSKTYNKVYQAKTRSYKDIVYNYGFPVKNKNFSEKCYRARHIRESNYRDVYKLITGVASKDIHRVESMTLNMTYAIELKFWFLARNYPIQTECCRILKKDPSRKLDLPMIIGIMKDDSQYRRTAINENYGATSKTKYFPIGDWNKSDILLYIELFNVEFSDAYKNRSISNDIEIVGATNTGCMGCHYGNTQNHYYIENGETKKTTKFENIKREKPRTFSAVMKMKHSSGITFKEVLDAYYDSLDEKYLNESINERNSAIDKVVGYMKGNNHNGIEIDYVLGFKI